MYTLKAYSSVSSDPFYKVAEANYSCNSSSKFSSDLIIFGLASNFSPFDFDFLIFLPSFFLVGDEYFFGLVSGSGCYD
jgi:hypothetical protein